MALPSDSSTRNTYALALLRIGVGILFLIFGHTKFSAQLSLFTVAFNSGLTNFSKAGLTLSWCPFCAALSSRMPRPSLSL